MLEGLDNIEWHRLRHAFGPAGEVPKWIRRLNSGDARERDRAALELFGCLWHDGGAFEVTPHTVPFLLELLFDGENVDRPWILAFLAHIANGRAPLEKRREVFGKAFEDTRPKLNRPPDSAVWTDEARVQVASALDQIRELQRDPDPDVRIAMSYLLAVFPEHSEESFPVVLQQLGSDDPGVRAGAGLAAVFLGRGGDVSESHVAQAFENESDPFPRWVFAFLLAMLRGDEVGADARTVLWTVAHDPESIEAAWARSPWSLIGCAAMTCDACRSMNLRDDEVSTARLLKALEHADVYSSLIIADALLQATMIDFGEPWTAAQRAVLRTIGESDRVWAFNLNTRRLLERYRLPPRREDFRAAFGSG